MNANRAFTLALALVAGTAIVAAQAPQAAAKYNFDGFAPLSLGSESEVITRQSPAIIDMPGNRLIFLQREVTVWVDCSPQLEQLGYEIDGLLDPELEFVQGAHVVFELVNWAMFSPSSFVVTAKSPPYTQDQPVAEGIWGHLVAHRAMLPPRIHPPQTTPGQVYGARLVYTFTRPGEAYYINVWIRQATMGMWGRIVVVP